MSDARVEIQITRDEAQALVTVLNSASEEFELSSGRNDEDNEYADTIRVAMDFACRAIDRLSKEFPT